MRIPIGRGAAAALGVLDDGRVLVQTTDTNVRLIALSNIDVAALLGGTNG